MRHIFDELVSAMSEAQAQRETKVLFTRAHDLGLTETPPIRDKMMRAFALSKDGKSVRLEHRWYDGSKAFSIRPDVNVFEAVLMGRP